MEQKIIYAGTKMVRKVKYFLYPSPPPPTSLILLAFFPLFQQTFGGASGPQLLQPQTDAILPPPKKKVPSDTPVKERLFILFHPHPLPVNVLEDVFW